MQARKSLTHKKIQLLELMTACAVSVSDVHELTISKIGIGNLSLLLFNQWTIKVFALMCLL